MRTYSFTASRMLPPGGQEFIEKCLAELVRPHSPRNTRYVTGACKGGDAVIGRWLAVHCWTAQHLVVVPASRLMVDVWWLGDAFLQQRKTGLLQVEYMPEGTSYKDRNIRLGVLGDEMVGFPLHAEFDRASSRSGSWQTLRIARRMESCVRWWSLDGTEIGHEVRQRG